MSPRDHPTTPDGRYFVARGRLWRCTDPRLHDSERRAALKALMQARHAMKGATGDALEDARDKADAAKHRLGERGPVWWNDGSPDESGDPPESSSYADWWHSLSLAGTFAADR